MKTIRMLGLGCGAVLLLPVLVVILIIGFSALALNPRTSAPMDYSGSAALVQPPPEAEPIVIKAITFNIANAYLFTTNRPERITALAALLRELDPDVVGLQECFVGRERERLLELLRDTRLCHHAVYPAATVGNGLLTLSAYPIVETYFHRYQHNNPWYKIHQGDWWAGKGVGLARIALPCGSMLDFYNTHAQAGRGDPDNAEVRLEQMRELAAFVTASRTPSAPGLIVGDFNTRVGRPDLEHAIQEAGLELLMDLDPGIDFIFGLAHDAYRYVVEDTVVLAGKTQGSKGAIFLSRAPTPGELWRMLRGPGEMTDISDHPGYMSTIRVDRSDALETVVARE